MDVQEWQARPCGPNHWTAYRWDRILSPKPLVMAGMNECGIVGIKPFKKVKQNFLPGLSSGHSWESFPLDSVWTLVKFWKHRWEITVIRKEWLGKSCMYSYYFHTFSISPKIKNQLAQPRTKGDIPLVFGLSVRMDFFHPFVHGIGSERRCVWLCGVDYSTPGLGRKRKNSSVTITSG